MTDSIREAYLSVGCNDAEVQRLVDVQLRCGAERWTLLSKYFNFWSHLGSGAFYILLLCLFAWTGYPLFAAYMCISLSITLVTTDNIKDALACPRPPSPPVFRGGDASHALEYGFPSTHTACAAVLAHIVAGFFLTEPQTRTNLYEFPRRHANLTTPMIAALPSDHSVHHPTTILILFAACFFVFHVAYSRMYLGLHWWGDLVGGLVCYCLWAILDALLFKAFILDHILGHLPRWVYAAASLFAPDSLLAALLINFALIIVPLLVGNWVLQLHATPRDACPCFEDSARFVGADCGLVIGCWSVLYDQWVAQLAGEKFQVEAAMSFSDKKVTSYPLLLGGIFYVVGVVLLIAGQEVSGKYLFPAILKPLLRFISGHSARSLPAALAGPYRVACTIVGAVFFLRKPEGQHDAAAAADSLNANSESSISSSQTMPHHGRSASGSVAITSVVVDVPSSSAPAGLLGGEGGASSSTSSSPIAEEPPSTVTVTCSWTLKCHTHWEEWSIQCKFLSYVVLGSFASYVLPVWLFPGLRAVFVEVSSGGKAT